jgi:hypothetical protein
MTEEEGPGNRARALAWVIPFSLRGGLKDLKKRLIRCDGGADDNGILSYRTDHLPRSFRPHVQTTNPG